MQKIIALDKKDSVQIVTMNNLAIEYSRTDLMKAKQMLYHSVALASSIPVYTSLSNSYAQLVNLHTDGGQPDSARHYLGLMQTLAADHTASTIEANYNFAAGEFYKKTGEFKKSIPYIRQALKVYSLLNDKVQTAGLTLNLGNAYLAMGLFKDALSYHLQALRLFEALSNKKGQSFCLQSVGNDLLNFNRFTEAIDYIQKGLVLKKELNDKRGMGTGLMALAQAYTYMNAFDTALFYARQALQINEELKVIPEMARGYYRMGEIYAGKLDSKTAIEYYTKARNAFLQMNDSALAANARVQIAALEIAGNRQKKTEQALFSSLHTSVESGDHFTEANTYKTLSAFYAEGNQYDKALAYNEKFHLITDSLAGNSLQVQLKTLERQYSMEKKEKEIALKEKEIALLKKDQLLHNTALQKERAIKASAFLLAALLAVIGFLVVNRYRVIQKAKRMVEIEKLRNDIARDLHDDIGSALSSININSNLALNRSEESELVKSQLEKIKMNSGKIMESMGDIVWAIHPGNDSMENLSARMKEFLTEMLEPLNITYQLREAINLHKAKLPVDKRKEIYLVFKEAINNAAKYSQCSNITVALSGDDKQFELLVEDNGKGFDMAMAKKGNGLRNMQQRAAAMGAGFTIKAGAGNGTHVGLKVPLT
ncbi:MAG: sensor histidine kinase [Chitinophagaceae bacterium]